MNAEFKVEYLLKMGVYYKWQDAGVDVVGHIHRRFLVC